MTTNACGTARDLTPAYIDHGVDNSHAPEDDQSSQRRQVVSEENWTEAVPPLEIANWARQRWTAPEWALRFLENGQGQYAIEGRLTPDLEWLFAPIDTAKLKPTDRHWHGIMGVGLSWGEALRKAAENCAGWYAGPERKKVTGHFVVPLDLDKEASDWAHSLDHCCFNNEGRAIVGALEWLAKGFPLGPDDTAGKCVAMVAESLLHEVLTLIDFLEPETRALVGLGNEDEESRKYWAEVNARLPIVLSRR